MDTVKFVLKDSNDILETSTERLDLLYGCTFLFSERDDLNGKIAINPLNGKEIPIFFNDSNELGVPGHNQTHFEFAQQNNLPIIEVLEPITGEPRENEEFRRSIVAIVENPNTGKVLSINWGPQMGGNLFIGGGIDENEDPIETAKREITEETGYKNVEFISNASKIHHHYFAHSKNVARIIEAHPLFFKLKDEKRANQNLEEDEKGKFKVEWITKEEALERVKDPLHNTSFRLLVMKHVYDGYGILKNSGDLNGLTSHQAIEKIYTMLN